jgi:O-antigen/teichoic acid export membrane protein
MLLMQENQMIAPEFPPSGALAAAVPAPSGIVRDLLGRYSDTIGAQVVSTGLGVISGMLLPRLLGPQGRGELAAITLWPITLVCLTTLGIDRAATFFASRNRGNVSPVASACLAIGGAQSLLVIPAGLVVLPIALRNYRPEVLHLSLLFLLAVPLIHANNFQASLLLGNLKTGWYNASRILWSLPYAVGVGILFLLGCRSIPAIVGLQVVAIAGAAILGYYALTTQFHPAWRWDASVVRAMLKYGAKTHFGQITYFMNQRLDQLWMALLLPSQELGTYVAAVAFADSLLIIPRGIATVTMAVGSNSDGAGARRWAKRSLLLSSAWLVPAATALWFSSSFLIPFLFGTKFEQSVLPCRILILGSCASGLSTVLSEAARSVNRPEIPSYAELAGLAVTVVLLAVLLKPYGPVGAAAASSVAYTATFLFNLSYFLKAPSEVATHAK